MDDITKQLAEALRLCSVLVIHGNRQGDEAIDAAREALRLYEQAKPAEPVALVPEDALAQMKDPLLLLRNVPMYAYSGEGLVPMFAAPVAQAEPRPEGEWPKCPSPYQGDQYIGYSRTDLLKYAREVLAAHGIKENQP